MAVVNSGFPRGGSAISKGGCEKLLFGQVSPQNCMKLKELGPQRGRQWRPLSSANALQTIIVINKHCKLSIRSQIKLYFRKTRSFFSQESTESMKAALHKRKWWTSRLSKQGVQHFSPFCTGTASYVFRNWFCSFLFCQFSTYFYLCAA